jgi:hypothetical protein
MFVKVNRNMISEVDLHSYTFTSLLAQHRRIQGFAPGMALLSYCFDSIPKKRSKFNWFKSR